jgi:hypothetical protein
VRGWGLGTPAPRKRNFFELGWFKMQEKGVLEQILYQITKLKLPATKILQASNFSFWISLKV